MKRLLATMGLVACLTAIPAPAVWASDVIEAKKCPDGYTGVIVSVNGNTVMVCQNIKP